MVTIKNVSFLPIALLLAFIFFSVHHTSNLSIQLHHSNKAVLVIDDWSMKSQSGDDQKHFFQFDIIGVLALLSSIVITNRRFFSRIHHKNFIFLLPVFHQSNYVISPLDA
ncbi:hypothetical protein V7124_25205 [Neobacillus niacini]|uniref:hypothetical protein n=1 Tax=Neobacillus niacini TaxID=86668 RepID=UPI0030007C15